MKKVFSILLLVSVMSLVLGGCSGGGEEAPAADAPAVDAPAAADE